MMGLRLRALLFPPSCVGCRALVTVSDYRVEPPFLCPACADLWKRETETICEQCGSAVSECLCVTEAMSAVGLKVCMKTAYYRHGVREPIQNRMVYRLKDARDRRLTAFFADALSARVEKLLRSSDDTAACALVPLPRSRASKLEHGTDQAEELAKALSLRTGIPICRLLERAPHADRAQKDLSPSERKRNARFAYRVSDRTDLPQDTRLILLDDIVTTGESMAAAAKLLRRAGFCNLVSAVLLSDDVNRTPVIRQPILRSGS